ncbi:MAG: hypothetical protein H0Z39_08770 [Peptococcaceae bacterium]|nr:hypothetical protein [Peptococcaceae bacterium]
MKYFGFLRAKKREKTKWERRDTVWIAVDVDNTVATTNLELVRRFDVSLKTYPSKLPPGFFDSREGRRVLQEVQPFPLAEKTLATLAGLGYRIAYVTCRSSDALFATIRWLQVHHFPVDQVVTISGDLAAARKEKLNVIRSLDPAAVFEDDPWVAGNLAGAFTVWLKDWPYNRKLTQGVIRFKSWQEVFEATVSTNPGLALALKEKR